MVCIHKCIIADFYPFIVISKVHQKSLTKPVIARERNDRSNLDPCKLRGHSGENEESQRLPRPDTPGLAMTFQLGLPRPDSPGLAMTPLQLFFGARCIIGIIN